MSCGLSVSDSSRDIFVNDRRGSSGVVRCEEQRQAESGLGGISAVAIDDVPASWRERTLNTAFVEHCREQASAATRSSGRDELR